MSVRGERCAVRGTRRGRLRLRRSNHKAIPPENAPRTAHRAGYHEPRTAHRAPLTAILLVCALTLSGPAQVVGAQEFPDTLTLDWALELARRHNPAYLRATAQADAAGAGIRAGVGAFLPSLTGSLGFSGNTSTRVTGEDDFGQPIRLPESITFRSSSASQSVSSQLTLFDGFQNVSNLRAARATADALDRGVDATALSVEAEVTRRFYAVVQAQRLIGVEERLLQIARAQFAATERLFGVAARSQLDVLGAEAAVAQQERAVAAAYGEARKARLRLAEQLGIETSAAFAVAGDLPAPFDPAALSADSLLPRAMAANPTLLRAEAEARQADFRAGAARGRYLPSVTASAAFNRSTSRQSFDALFDFNPLNRGFNFGFQLSVPLFDRFQTPRAVAEAAVAERVAEENLRQARLELERGVRSALIDLAVAYQRVQLADRALGLSRRRLAMAEEQYQLGTIGFVELQQIVDAAARDERAALNAQLEFASAVVALEELVGAPLR